jgi:hypothetical protein
MPPPKRDRSRSPGRRNLRAPGYTRFTPIDYTPGDDSIHFEFEWCPLCETQFHQFELRLVWSNARPQGSELIDAPSDTQKVTLHKIESGPLCKPTGQQYFAFCEVCNKFFEFERRR